MRNLDECHVSNVLYHGCKQEIVIGPVLCKHKPALAEGSEKCPLNSSLTSFIFLSVEFS